jgi:hypothetical protein
VDCCGKSTFNALEYIKFQSEYDTSNDQIISNRIESAKVNLSANGSYFFPSDNNSSILSSTTVVILISKDEFSGATAYLKAIIKTLKGPGGVGKAVSYCSIYSYYLDKDSTVTALARGYCGASTVIVAKPLCGYIHYSFDSQYS